MIYGIGTDIIRTSRVRSAIRRRPERFLGRILTPAERAECARRAEPGGYAAKRFAAKEAFVKALGTGFRAPAVFSRISVLNDPAGRPHLVFAEDLRVFLSARSVADAHVSLADDGDWSLATVILTRAAA